jgi:DNA gyrase subunit B
MRVQLMERGVTDAELDMLPGTGNLLIKGAKMEHLTRLLADVEEAILGLERRGVSLKAHAERIDGAGKLPEVHAVLRGREHWFADVAAFNEFREQEEAAGRTISVSDTDGSTKEKLGGKQAPAAASTTGEQSAEVTNGSAAPSELQFTELHEVRTINRALAALARFFDDLKIDLTFNLGLRIDTSFGAVRLGASTFVGFIPFRSDAQ